MTDKHWFWLLVFGCTAILLYYRYIQIVDCAKLGGEYAKVGYSYKCVELKEIKK